MTKHFRADYWDSIVWQEIRAFLTDPIQLVNGIKEVKREQDEVNEPLRNRLMVIEDLIDHKKKELGRLLDIFLAGEFPEEVLYERKERLERTIQDLEAEQKSVTYQIGQSITDQQLSDLQLFAESIGQGLCEADNDFELRSRLLDFLHVKVDFSVEEEIEIAELYCEFSLRNRIRLSNVSSSTCQSSSHQPESELPANSHAGEVGNYMPNYKHSMDCMRN